MVKVSNAQLEIGLQNPNRLLKSILARRLFVVRKASKEKILRARDTQKHTAERNIQAHPDKSEKFGLNLSPLITPHMHKRAAAGITAA